MTPDPDHAVAVVRDAFDLHFGAIVGWTERLILDADLAHEVVIDAFAQLLKQNKSPEDVRSTLYAQVLRAVLDHWTQEGTSPVRPAARALRPNDTSARTAHSVGMSLPVRSREAFLLHWYAGLSVAEIVATTSNNSKSTRRDIADAKAALTAQVGELSDEEIEEFFIAERSAVHPLPATADHWEQIVHEAGRETRSWFWPGAGALGVIAILLFVWSVQQNPFGDSGVQAGNHVEATQDEDGQASGNRPLPTSGPQPVRSVPGSFVPWSLAHADAKTVFAMGASSCDVDDVCPTLVRSADHGKTWRTVHRFEDSDTAAVASDEVPRIQPSRAVTEVRFASPTVGFAFGGDLWRTSDAGKTFYKIQLSRPGQTVLDVAISQGTVVVLSADGCSQGQCTGPLMLSRADANSPDLGAPATVLELAGDRPIDSAQLVLSDGEVFVQPYRVDGNIDPPWRLVGKELLPVGSGPACANDPLEALTSTTNGSSKLFALCGGVIRGNQAEYRLVRSEDDGKTWTAASSTPIALPRLGRLSLAAIDDQRLVVATGGPRKVSGPTRVTAPSRMLQVTQNRGKTWRPVTDPAPPAQGIDWTGAPGGAEVLALTRTGPSIWRSLDFGKKWTLLDPRQRPSSATSTTSAATP
ncbi:hypothetical protein [Demetria terragena]|uniref:hypothetical protein n=1 Tax=Demetria terragena TaxID=63959 RepID=UPI000477DC0D|nr:hypothetical protein [Demetria terragena]